jgi:hypothetical protein
LLTPGDGVVYGFEVGGEWVEAGWEFVDDVCGLGAELRGVAEHLDGVAEAVEAAYDEALAGDMVACPEAVGVGCVALAQGVGLLPGLFEVAREHVELPEVAGNCVGIGTESPGLFKSLPGLRQVALQQKGLGVGEGFLRAGRGSHAHWPPAG